MRRVDLLALYDRVTNLEIDAHEKVENEYDRLAALEDNPRRRDPR